ncbi:unnamed protein product [Fraxinus pennsylvanica]|uniref:Uncharacterized protein n=1 Tax=Fraxinus pennsylvanica TaxID=56036 RepID=A0AAD2A7H6_9LAMI|nr:unnamed protein product [Fraxinus pennsylvanica]
MRGSASEPGVIPLAVYDLFNIIHEIIESREKTDDAEADLSCDAVRVSVLIHVDNIKNSLQFASRAFRVTNGAHVNEILTDAALLKRQRKEIDELRAKLEVGIGFHSELERERMALELEEEKKAQAEREKRLQEQVKKIENLSSMVFYTNRDEIREVNKKLCSTVKEMPSVVKSTRADCKAAPLLPFEELVNEIDILEMEKSSSQQNLDSVVELVTEQTISARRNLKRHQALTSST